jgi:ribosome-binding factor A
MRKHSSKHSGSEPSQRQLRVGEQIRHIISQTLQRGHFRNEYLLDSASLITVSEVRASPDLKHARVYVMALGGENMEKILPALNDEAHVFQKEIARQANLKFTPKVKFVTDDSFANAAHIEDLLRGVRITADHGDDSDEGTEES